MYFPVAEETRGGTSKLRSKGLKTVPPPRPKQPQSTPPMNDTERSLTKVLPLNLMSVATIPLLYFSFKAISLFAFQTENIVMQGHNNIKAAIISQSYTEHFLIPIMEA